MKMFKTSEQSLQPLSIVVWGLAGVGKTRLCATTGPNAEHDTVVVSAEGGTLSLRDSPLTAIEVKSKEDVIDAYRWVTESSEAEDLRWVCLDSLSEVAESVLGQLKEEHRDPRRAYGEMQDVMTKLIRSFRDCGRNVYMTAKAERIQDETGALIWGPSMPGQKLAQQIPYFVDEIFALLTHRDDETGEIKRWLQTQPDGKRVCKDRSGALDMHEPLSLFHIEQKIKGEL